LLLNSCVKLVIKRSCRLHCGRGNVVSFDEVSRVRPSVSRDSELIYGSIACCEARNGDYGAIHQAEIHQATVKPKHRPGRGT